MVTSGRNCGTVGGSSDGDDDDDDVMDASEDDEEERGVGWEGESNGRLVASARSEGPRAASVDPSWPADDVTNGPGGCVGVWVGKMGEWSVVVVGGVGVDVVGVCGVVVVVTIVVVVVVDGNFVVVVVDVVGVVVDDGDADDVDGGGWGGAGGCGDGCTAGSRRAGRYLSPRRDCALLDGGFDGPGAGDFVASLRAPRALTPTAVSTTADAPRSSWRTVGTPR